MNTSILLLEDDTILATTIKELLESLRTAITKLKQTTGLNIKNIRSIGYTLEQS